MAVAALTRRHPGHPTCTDGCHTTFPSHERQSRRALHAVASFRKDRVLQRLRTWAAGHQFGRDRLMYILKLCRLADCVFEIQLTAPGSVFGVLDGGFFAYGFYLTLKETSQMDSIGMGPENAASSHSETRCSKRGWRRQRPAKIPFPVGGKSASAGAYATQSPLL